MEEKLDTYCVYKHTNKFNGKIYIGLTKYGDDPNKRWLNGKGYRETSHLYNAIKKDGWDNFEHEILYNNLTLEEANYYEKLLIEQHHTLDPDFGYNKQSGGKAYKLNEEGLKNLKASKNTPEFKSNMSQKMTGKKLFPNGRKFDTTHNQKISIAHQGSKWMFKNNIYKRVLKSDIDNYLKEGWIFKCSPKGKGKRTEETFKQEGLKVKEAFQNMPEEKKQERSNKLSKALKGLICINNNFITKKIKPDELEYYLNQGWVKGRIKNSIKKED